MSPHLPGRIDPVLELVLDDDQPRFLSGVRRDHLTLEEWAQFKRLLQIVEWSDDGLYVRRNRLYQVGRVVLPNAVVTIPPAFDPSLFVDFYLYASGVNLDRFAQRQRAPVDLNRGGRHDVFLVLLAELFVELAEKLITLGVARTYMPIVERARLIRGRPMWSRDFGHHPAEGVTCGYHTLTTENLPNQLIVTGLAAAARSLHGTPNVNRVLSQLFAWRSMADEMYPTSASFDQAVRQLNRLTAHYRPALALARAFTLGFSPVDLFSGRADALQALEFSLPALFEQFLERLVRDACESRGLQVRAQARDGRAIIDGNGDTYRAVKPDLVVFRQGKPVAVIDAKYKPRYLVPGVSGSQVLKENRVNNEDIYQMCFYQARLTSRYGLSAPPKALIVAPLVPATHAVVDVSLRTIRWVSGGQATAEGYGLTLYPLPLGEVVQRLKKGFTGFEALEPAQELADVLRNL